MTKRDDMELVAKDGELWLYASADRKKGLLYDSMTEIESELRPLQIFFKWGNFVSVEQPTSTTLP